MCRSIVYVSSLHMFQFVQYASHTRCQAPQLLNNLFLYKRCSPVDVVVAVVGIAAGGLHACEVDQAGALGVEEGLVNPGSSSSSVVVTLSMSRGSPKQCVLLFMYAAGFWPGSICSTENTAVTLSLTSSPEVVAVAVHVCTPPAS